MREHGKDAARSGPDTQGLDRANQASLDQQSFAVAVGTPAARGLNPFIAEGIAAFRRDLADLYQTHRNEWVAYHGEKRLEFGPKKVELYNRMLETGINREELVLKFINEDSLYETGIYDSSANSL